MKKPQKKTKLAATDVQQNKGGVVAKTRLHAGKKGA